MTLMRSPEEHSKFTRAVVAITAQTWMIGWKPNVN
jgi:hypothetical protein